MRAWNTMLFAAAVLSSGCSPKKVATATLPYVQDFGSAALGPEWNSVGGGWSIVDGRLFNSGARNVPLWLSALLPRDLRVTFEAESKSPAVDLKFEIFGDGRNHQSGYVIIVAGWGNSKSIIARLDEHGPERSAAVTAKLRSEVGQDPNVAASRYRDSREIIVRRGAMQPNRRYRFRLERRSHEMRLFIDDTLHLEYFDPSPLSGRGQDRFAFNNWASLAYFDNLKIEPLD